MELGHFHAVAPLAPKRRAEQGNRLLRLRSAPRLFDVVGRHSGTLHLGPYQSVNARARFELRPADADRFEHLLEALVIGVAALAHVVEEVAADAGLARPGVGRELGRLDRHQAVEQRSRTPRHVSNFAQDIIHSYISLC
jgi:hypothetical protein